jgi:ABC-type sugar transport system ATPase subunit
MAGMILQGVSKTYARTRHSAGHTAVHPADLEIHDGEFLVLVGPSGCGKTTILRMIAGLEEVTEGSILIDGQKVNDLPPHERDIAMVFQNYALYPHMSVFDNMAFGLRFRRLPKDEIRRRVESAARKLGLMHPNNLLQRKPKALSGGQRQRVALGRAMVRQAGILLFDEPLSNLDAKMRLEMRTEILRLHREIGATVVYVTHDQVEAMTMADRIVVMDHGFVQQAGPPREIYLAPANLFVARFIGSPPMNILRGALYPDGTGLRFLESGQDGPVPPMSLDLRPTTTQLPSSLRHGEVTLGIRPEHVHLGGSASDCSFQACVEMVENSGSESTLYLRTGGHRLAAKVASSWDKSMEGIQAEFSLEQSKILFFDPVSEKRFDQSQVSSVSAG